MKLHSLLLLAPLVSSTFASGAENYAPIGELSIDASLVRAGVKPTINWKISYPSSTVEDVVTIGEDDSIYTEEEVRMDVRLLGASFSMDGRTPSPVNFKVKVGSDSWKDTFTGTETQIDPSEVVFSQQVGQGTEINFAGAGQTGSTSWTASRNTLTDNLNVIALKDGDSVPTYTPAFNQGKIDDHVSGYIKDGKVALGPRDVIYLIELYSTNPGSTYFDMQDLVVVVTFDEKSTTTTTTTTSTTTTTTTTNTSANGVDENTSKVVETTVESTTRKKKNRKR